MPRETLIIKIRNLCSGNAMIVLRTMNVCLKQNTVCGKTDKGKALK